VAIGARFPGILDALCALPGFNIGLNERMVFFGAFATAALAALGMERLREGGASGTFLAACAASLLLIAYLYRHAQPHVPSLGMSAGHFPYRTLLQATPVLFCAGLWLAFRRRGAETAFFVSALILLALERRLEEGDFYPTYPNRAFYPRLQSLEAIPRGAPYRMTAVGWTFIPNIAALYELEDVRGYEAMTFKPLVDTFPLWCVPQPVWYNRVDDPTRPFFSFLNVRYVLAPPRHPPPAGWKALYRGQDAQLFENPEALPRAFVPRVLRFHSDGPSVLHALAGIRDFGREGVVAEDPPAGESGSRRDNGEASVRIAAYEPQRMTLDIEAEKESVIGTSVTGWPGWKLEIDGKASPFVRYNHAFLGFRVPPGRHTAVLRYLPDSFLAGSVISVLTMVAAIVLLLRPRPPAALG
jgi:hypothetical protein